MKNKQEKETTMKEELIRTVRELRNSGIDIAETPPLFRWTYDEEPDVMFQLLITPKMEAEEVDEEIPEGEIVH